MKQDIRLYLAGQRADLGDDTKILYNYRVTDTQNPTVVKNSFSKSIVLEGTDNNNAIFGEIYDLSRLQSYGTGNYAGIDFNPLRKADFALYIDSELYETGYFKLTEITKNIGKISYSITLFGGLGEFLFNLEESGAGNKLEFKDLTLIRDLQDPVPVPDLTFSIDMNTIKDAWDNINSYSSRYSTLNFAPCYNGLPTDFDSDNVLINLNGKPSEMGNVSGITSYNGWAKGSCSRELSEWEIRDLRAGLQRPVLRVKHLINSCCYPENNGGYSVDLDRHFFNSDNPYWENAWVTLPMSRDIMGIDGTEESEPVSGATITGATIAGTDDYQAWYYDIIAPNVDFSSYSNLAMDLEVNFITSGSSTNADVLYTSCKQIADTNFTLSSKYLKSYKYYSAILLQLVAYDELGKVVASSSAYQLMSKVDESTQPDFRSNLDGSVVNIPEWKTLYGYFKKQGTGYTWCDMNGTPQHLNFRFPSATSFYSLKLRLQRPVWIEQKYTGIRISSTTNSTGGGYKMWPTSLRNVSGNHEPDYFSSYGVAMKQNPLIDQFTATATRYGGFITGKEISQNRILTLGVTPGQFLLSYIKMFGLHIWKDPIKKQIYIADRGVYYDTENIVDINDFVDRSKEMKITPQVAQSRWYDFNTEQHESEANTQYTDEYGYDFGLARVNTSFDFDSSNTEVYDGIFRGGIQVLENSPYYYEDYYYWPVFCYNGFTLTTFAAGGDGLEGTEHTVNTQTGANIYPLNPDYTGFDLMDKPQFHTADNEGSDGSLTLLFFEGTVPATSSTAGGIKYFITNDIGEMVILNEKKPCWILTETEYDMAGKRIGIQMSYLPHFSRYLYYQGNGYITHTWDFGKTLETYLPGTTLTQGCSIYEKFWKAYISDMYDVNSRILSCRCLLKGQVNPEWLQRFYYFDNAMWRLNTIKEWNPGSYETTMCEFLKVNDLASYGVDKPTSDPDIDFYLPDYVQDSAEGTDFSRSRYYTISAGVSAVTADILVQDGGPWYFGDGPGAEYTVNYDNGTSQYPLYSTLTQSGADSGMGSSRQVLMIGTNQSRTGRTFRFNIVVYGSSGDLWRNIYLRQEAGDIGYMRVNRFAGSGNVAGAGMKVLLSIYSPSPWRATQYDEYVSLDRTTGPSGTTTIEMTVEANPSTSSTRECRVRFNSDGGSGYEYVITQDPSGVITNLDFSAATYIFETCEAATIAAQVACPTGITWSITGAPDWLTVSPSTGGSGITQVTLSATANPDYETRWADISITGGAFSQQASFGQWGRPREGITITLDTYSPPATGFTDYGRVDSSVNGWHFEYPAWLVPSVLTGNSGRTYFSVAVAPNNTGYGRVGTLTAAGGNYSDQVSITQDAQ